MNTVMDIYNIINSAADFSSAEKWDNCGLLCGDMNAGVTKILTTLDITVSAVEEAIEKGAELIVSHHPVIFSPLKAVDASSPVGMMLRHGISAICTHTPFDMCPKGMNKGLYELLREPLSLTNGEPLEFTGDGLSIGMVYDMAPMSARDTAAAIKAALGCTAVRFTDRKDDIRRIAVSSGAGNDFISLAASKGADALASGDIKHDRLVLAKDMGFTVIDCGHFHTERIFCGLMKDIICEAVQDIEVAEAESCTDPADYII